MSERLTVGQKLWKVPGEPRQRKYAGWVEIESVGRKWATTKQRDRIHIETLRTQSGYGYQDRFYLSREEYEEEFRLACAWSLLEGKFRALGARRPSTTIEKIEQAISLLGYDVAEFRAALSREEGR
ncbi:beta barrel domain-containing protein [Aureimonas sp. N4]|uniref:beta barrel domain-containing protein n=1 Tax=Aureimonas sp. N4 TaxID=1638165 RepID=UPI00078295F9|nr:hypothetical protein [Aureimonas sp. N4]